MKYESTRGNFEKITSSRAIRLGMVPKGGLFVPENFPKFSEREIFDMENEGYQEIALRVLEKYLSDFTNKEIEDVISCSYGENFDTDEVAPVVRLKEKEYLLELWHGPTAAFKDIPLQFLPNLLSRSIESETVILVATSGDTGKAALEGFKDVKKTKIIVFYPKEGVSRMQELQMRTTGGKNTSVVALEGNFDDCQNGIKEIFADEEFKGRFEQGFSSANSINWGRLVPQIVYWFAAYSDLLDEGEIEEGQKIDIVVPTGNFGNILSTYYAHLMGLPVANFVCASNENKILTDFFRTGIYDTNREFKKTISPAMDILVSSNLERFLYDVSGRNSNKVTEWYEQLEKYGKFSVDDETKGEMGKLFDGEYSTEDETLETIKRVFEAYHYPLDPHTAVGVSCFRKFRRKGKDENPTLIASTANPFKFAPSVLRALSGEDFLGKEFDALVKLKEITGWPIHRGLKDLKEENIKHDFTCSKGSVREVIEKILND